MHCILDSIITIYYILFLGWKQIPYHWCTIQGRKFLSGKKGVKQYFWQCARQCNKIRGCNAVEMWFAYNWNCYWCTRLDLIRPYTNKHDLAYPAHVWVRSKSRLNFIWYSQTHEVFMQSKTNKWRPFGSGEWILTTNETPEFSSEVKHVFHLAEIKHLHFNEMLYWLTELMETMQTLFFFSIRIYFIL